MAEIQDLDAETSEEISEIDAVTETKEQSAEGSESLAEAQPEDEIPERYRGKSLKQLAEELEHANKSMGRYANELGEVRKLADELIKSQLVPQKQADKPSEVDFFENPQEAIRRAVEMNPEVQAAKQYAVAARQAQAKAEFERKHPDFGQVLQEQEFGSWLQKSKVRMDLWQKAANFDVDAADELFSTYKELKAVKTVKQQATQAAVSETEKAARKDAMQAASVQTGGTGEVGRKIYRRADLINLRLRDPAKFAAMQDDIDAAYREGRVR